ncbi:MFS transporter [Acetivibrio cellulolyticus]|uniref:MFS transporter n=1 Tax=Acetivibrio cellulolyticus TaxID=35830 RepID=UPI0001E2FB31|nr:MFS transporter [Acetivibrio cellulolyticus]
MFNHKNSDRYPYCFLIYYALNFMATAVFGVFMPVYLKSLNYNNGQIGVLLALGSFVALFAQPVWGVASDRAKTKNSILMFLLFSSNAIIILFRLSTNYYYIFCLLIILAFFQTPINAISDAITLEHMAGTRWKFGPIRFAGTMGYACIAVIAGIMVKKNINGIFFLSFIIGLVVFIVSFSMPRVQGHQSKANKISIMQLFKNRELMILIFFTVTVHITLSFYNAFFSIYYKDMGADSTLLGWAIFIASVSEVFFLFKGDKIIEKLGIRNTLLGAAIIAVIRWLLLGVVSNIYIILVMQVLHGFIYIVLSYSMANYINKEVPKELKASGQTLNSVITAGFSKLIGNIGGGMLSDVIGIRQVFLLGSLIILFSIAIFYGIFIKNVKQT